MGNIGSLMGKKHNSLPRCTTACQACHPCRELRLAGFRDRACQLSQGSFWVLLGARASLPSLSPCQQYLYGKTQPAELVTPCHRYVTLSVTAGFAGFRHGFSACVDVAVLSPPRDSSLPTELFNVSVTAGFAGFRHGFSCRRFVTGIRGAVGFPQRSPTVRVIDTSYRNLPS